MVLTWRVFFTNALPFQPLFAKCVYHLCCGCREATKKCKIYFNFNFKVNDRKFIVKPFLLDLSKCTFFSERKKAKYLKFICIKFTFGTN